MFFNPTSIYKEMLLLEHIENNLETTQIEISKDIDASLGMVNKYINELEELNYLSRNYKSIKTVSYRITPKGIKRRKYLQIRYIKELMDHNIKANNIAKDFLNYVSKKDFKEVFFYGAGEVAEILLNIILNGNIKLKVLGIIDDDIEKQGKYLKTIPIKNKEALINIKHDGIIITSYTYEKDILKMLLEIEYSENKIIKYFDIE